MRFCLKVQAGENTRTARARRRGVEKHRNRIPTQGGDDKKNVHGAEGGNAIFHFLNTSNEITPRSKNIYFCNEFQWFSNIMESVFIF